MSLTLTIVETFFELQDNGIYVGDINEQTSSLKMQPLYILSILSDINLMISDVPETTHPSMYIQTLKRQHHPRLPRMTIMRCLRYVPSFLKY